MNALWEILSLSHPFFTEIDEVKHQTTILWVVIFRYVHTCNLYILYYVTMVSCTVCASSLLHFTFQILELSIHIISCLEFQKTRSNISIIFNLRNFLFTLDGMNINGMMALKLIVSLLRGGKLKMGDCQIFGRMSRE